MVEHGSSASMKERTAGLVERKRPGRPARFLEARSLIRESPRNHGLMGSLCVVGEKPIPKTVRTSVSKVFAQTGRIKPISVRRFAANQRRMANFYSKYVYL
jgi:hypothetical protein